MLKAHHSAKVRKPPLLAHFGTKSMPGENKGTSEVNIFEENRWPTSYSFQRRRRRIFIFSTSDKKIALRDCFAMFVDSYALIGALLCADNSISSQLRHLSSSTFNPRGPSRRFELCHFPWIVDKEPLDKFLVSVKDDTFNNYYKYRNDQKNFTYTKTSTSNHISTENQTANTRNLMRQTAMRLQTSIGRIG